MELQLLRQRLAADFPLHLEPQDNHPDQSSVLVILYPKHGRSHVLLLKRAAGLSRHSGEIAFPGGLYEEKDKDLLTTAIRETREELDLHIHPTDIIARLSTVTTRTGIDIAPFVTIQDSLNGWKSNPSEVEEVLEAPLVKLFNTYQRDPEENPSDFPFVFWHQHHRIWGATAKILNQLSELAS